MMQWLTIPRACLITGAYQLFWALPLLVLGSSILTGELGSAFAPAMLAEHPVLDGWVRLMGTSLLGMGVIHLVLSRVREVDAQLWIRRAWMAYWLIELGIDTVMFQLPALLAGEPQASAATIATSTVGRSAMVVVWFLARPSDPA